MSARGRAGFTALEALVALLLTVLVVSAGWRALSVQRRAGEAAAAAAERRETLRIVRTVLGEEIRAGSAGLDWGPAAGDSVPVRAFRGVGIRCQPPPAPDQMVVRVQGVRSADPVKDSLLLLDGEGRWHVAGLTSRRAGLGCAAGSSTVSAELWILDRDLASALVARFFERGVYHVFAGTLRYRRGLGGRQPMTPVVMSPSSGLSGTGALRVDVELQGSLAGAPVERREWSVWPREEDGS